MKAGKRQAAAPEQERPKGFEAGKWQGMDGQTALEWQ